MACGPNPACTLFLSKVVLGHSYSLQTDCLKSAVQELRWQSLRTWGVWPVSYRRSEKQKGRKLGQNKQFRITEERSLSSRHENFARLLTTTIFCFLFPLRKTKFFYFFPPLRGTYCGHSILAFTAEQKGILRHWKIT